MANAEEIAAWDGDAGAHWVREAARFDAMLRPFGDALVATADPRPGERVLEVGCGTGALAVELARLVAPGGRVTAVDVSGPMLAEAARRAAAAGVDVDWLQADAQVHPFGAGAFDVVTSRFGIMFFDDPAAAFANLAGALAPGGRLVVTCWRDLAVNEWIAGPAGAALAHVLAPPAADPGRPGPFALADPHRVRSLVSGAGLDGVAVDELDAPMRMGDSVDDVVRFFRRSELATGVIGRAGPEAQEAAWAAVRELLSARTDAGGAVVLGGAAWLVSARRPA